MDEQIKKPFVVLLWVIVMAAAVILVLFIVGMIWGLTSPELFV